jgi:hypothetical protein
MDPELVNMTVGCGISHTVTKTHISKILSAYTKTQDELVLDNTNSSTE